MDVKELRIGSLVNVPNEKQSPFRIDGFEYLRSIDGQLSGKVEQFTANPHYNPDDKRVLAEPRYYLHPLTWNLEDLQPIPLTEELLLKCGFEEHDNVFHSELFIYNNGNLTIIADDYNNVGKTIKVCYLHQLQNLYFALMGTELEIQL